MENKAVFIEGEGDETGLRPGLRPLMGGVEVREEDIEPQKGLHIAAIVFRVSAVIIFILAMVQFVAWWLNRPPGGVGVGLLIGDTIRLVVFAALLWAVSDLAALWIKTHYDIRAARILLARQTYMMRQMGVARGTLPPLEESDDDRRGVVPEDTVEPGTIGPHA